MHAKTVAWQPALVIPSENASPLRTEGSRRATLKSAL